MFSYSQCLIFVTLFFSQVKLLEYDVKSVSDLKNSSIYSIHQDKNGVMWFGTADGLFKYDGSNYTLFSSSQNSENYIDNHDISRIIHASDSTLYIGTWGGGLYEVDIITNKLSKLPEKSKYIQSIFKDNENLYIGTFNKGLKFYNLTSSDEKNIIRAKIEDDRIWDVKKFNNHIIAGTDNGIVFYSLNILEIEKRINSNFRSNQIRAVSIHNKKIYFGTTEELIEYDPETEKQRIISNKPIRINLFYKSENKLYIGSLNGLYIYDFESEDYEIVDAINKNLLDKDVRSIYKDLSGLLWIGTRKSGIYKVNNNDKNIYKVEIKNKQNENFNRVWAIQKVDDTFYIGSDGGLVLMNSENKVIKTIDLDAIQNRSSISAISEKLNNKIWIGSYENGLYVYDLNLKILNPITAKDKKGDIVDFKIIRTIKTIGDKVLIGTRGVGLYIFDPLNSSAIKVEKIPDLYINTIFTDKNKMNWIGTENGFYKTDSSFGQFRYFNIFDNVGQSTLFNDVLSINQFDYDSNSLWIATRVGLLRYQLNLDKYNLFVENIGLKDKTIYSILDDRSKNLWLSTNSGLVKFNPKSMRFRHFYQSSDQFFNKFNFGAFFKSDDNKLYFGGINGINIVEPDKIKDLQYQLPISINIMKVNSKEIRDKSKYSKDDIIIEGIENSIFIDYKIQDYFDPERATYSHKLEGLDTDWNYTKSDHTVHYTNLNFGTYHLRLRATSKDGFWIEKNEKISIQVIPFFWEHPLFRVMMALFTLGLLIVIHKLRVRYYKKQKSILQAEVEKRTVELESKTVLLENVNSVIKTINNENDFDHLLESIIDTHIVEHVDRASVVIYSPIEDCYIFKTAIGWDLEQLKDIKLTHHDVDYSNFGNFKEITDQIYVCTNVVKSIDSDKFKGLESPKSILAIQIKILDDIIGYIYLDNFDDEYAFINQDLQLLENLRDHIVTIFVKTKMLEDLKQLNIKKNEFLGIAAHDLRSPLCQILGHSDMIKYQIEGTEVSSKYLGKHLEKIHMATTHMQDIISSLLDISAIESGKISLKMLENDINQVIEDSIDLNRSAAIRKNIHITFQKNGTKGFKFDRHRILEVLDNLVSNAIKYTEVDGKVDIHVDSSPEEICVNVKDTGIGLSESDKELVFKSFMPLSAKPTAGEQSTGFGLAIVKKIVDLHKGQVFVESEKGKGSLFGFKIPITE